MKIETVYKGTCVLLGVCLITMMGYNVGVSKGEETDTSKDGIPDWWELTKPKVEWIGVELVLYHRCPYTHNTDSITTYIDITNTLDYPIPTYTNEYGDIRCKVWFLNGTEGWQHEVTYIVYFNATYVCNLLPKENGQISLKFKISQEQATPKTIYYEAFIKKENTIVKGVCEIPNITP